MASVVPETQGSSSSSSSPGFITPESYGKSLSTATNEKLYIDPGDPASRALVPGCCSGAHYFFMVIVFWLIVTIILPFGVFLPRATKSDKPFNRLGEPLYYAAWICFGSGIVYLLKSIFPAIWEGGVAMPKPSDPHVAFTNAEKGEKSHYVASIKRITVIVNPMGGVRSGLATLNNVVLPIWERKGIVVDIKETQHRGHARELSRTLDLDTCDALCAVGGDGTIHEVMNGMCSRTDGKSKPLGFIPGGSGNSFMLDLGTWNASEAAVRIANGNVCYQDVNVLEVSGERIASMNVIAWGLVGDVGIVAESVRCLGPSRYDICGFFLMLKKLKKRCTLRIQSQSEQKEISGEYATFFINHTQNFGKGMRAAPLAYLDDGVLDMCIAKVQARGKTIAAFQQLPLGAHVSASGIPGLKGVQYEQGIRVECDVHKPGALLVDGEIVAHDGSFAVTCVHKALAILCPPSYENKTLKAVQRAAKGNKGFTARSSRGRPSVFRAASPKA